jgi:hypothetical protein
MDRFAQFAYFTTARDASFVAVAAGTLMIAFSFDPALALNLGGHVAMLFCLGLLHRLVRLEERGVLRTEAWKELKPDERPCDAPGLTGAHRHMERTLVRFARGASGVAGVLFGGSLVASLLI